MSSMAIYVYDTASFRPRAILARHENHPCALSMSPHDANLLACAITSQELRVYDIDSELVVASVRYTTHVKTSVHVLEWHRQQPGVLLLGVGPQLVAWDFAAAGLATPDSSGGGALSNGVAPSPPPAPPKEGMLSRLKANLAGTGSDPSAGAVSAGAVPNTNIPAGKWVPLRDMGAALTAVDQAGGGAGGFTLLAVATADGHVTVLELEPSGLAVRGELRSIALPGAPPPGAGNAGGTVSGGPGSGLTAAASAVAWEPLSGNGLLLAVGRGGNMALYDTQTAVPEEQVVLQYGKQPATATRFAHFLSSQPGNFLLSSSRSGALQLWNVSQAAALRTFKLGGGLVQSFALLTLPGMGRAPASSASSTTPGHMRPSGSGYAAPPSASSGERQGALVSFADGGLCVFDLSSQQVLWRQEGGHTETIFDCRFSTADHNLLATASFDSTVRVWDVRTARCIKILSGAEGVLYSVSWNCEGRMLAASNDSGLIFVYDYHRGLLIKSLRQHTKQSLKVAFHPFKPNTLASSSIDGTVYVYTVDGETVRTLRHFTPVSCIAWCPAPHGSPGSDVLASTTESGELHIWDTSRPASECLVRTLSKHNSRVFNVEFSPLLHSRLLSSSNDRTGRVWDVDTGECIAVLEGHTDLVRAVAWHPEVAHICFTGSWDGSIRVWDARSGRCLVVSNDHHSDVYGIACHPARPFFLATCSRDTTLRMWSTLDLTPHLMPQALVRPLGQLRASPEEAARLPEAAPAVMAGSGSRELELRLGNAQLGPLERYAAITEFFMPPACLDTFWDIVRAVRNTAAGGAHASAGGSGGADVPGAAAASRRRASGVGLGLVDRMGNGEDGSGLFHWTAARLAVGSAANHLELAAASTKARSGGTAGSSRREELLREAAAQHLVAGNVEHAVELWAEVGDWDRALALAPVVGLDLWARLLRRRLEAMAASEAQNHVNELLPMCLVSGGAPKVVDLLAATCLYDTAFNVAAISACGGYPTLEDVDRPGGAFGGAAGNTSDPCNTRRMAAAERWHSASGGGAGSSMSPDPSGLRTSTGGGSGTTSGAGGAFTAAAASLSGSGVDWFRASGTLPETPFAPLATATSASGGLPPTAAGSTGGAGGASGGGSSGGLPPVMLRSGTLPALGRRPVPLAPLQPPSLPPGPPPLPSPSPSIPAAEPSALSQSAELAVPPSPTRQPPMSPSGAGAALLSSASGMAPAPPSGLRSGPAMRLRGSQTAAVASPSPAGPSATSMGGTISSSGAGVARPEGLDRAISVRAAQARVLSSQGLPVPAACCALSVDEVAGAVGLLLRGDQAELALALVSALTRPVGGYMAAAAGAGGVLGAWGVGPALPAGAGVEAVAAALRPRVLLAAAARREATGDFLTAADLMKQVPGRADLAEMLAGRCRAHADPPTANRVYSALALQPPASHGPFCSGLDAKVVAAVLAAAERAAGGDSGDPAGAAARALLLAGQTEAAADRAVACVRRLVESGRRLTLTSVEWEQAWTLINSLSPSCLGKAVWSQVFTMAAYVGALVALEQGWPAVGLYLVRVLEAWAESGQPGAKLPVAPSRLAAEVAEALDACLALPGVCAQGPGQGEALAVLQQLAAACEGGSSWLQGVLQARIAAAAEPGSLRQPGSPPRASHHASTDGGACLPSAPMSPPLHKTPSGRRLASLGGAALTSSTASNGGGSLLLGASTGRLAAGGAVAAALASLPPVATVTTTSANGGFGGGGGGGGAAEGAGAHPVSLADLARGPVVVAAQHVPSRSAGACTASGALPVSAVSGQSVRGAVLVLDGAAGVCVSLSEAVALRRAMAYCPTGSGKLLKLP
ncbi:hypothetical protein HYH03_000661 [Edaphochlamys debaryana]|uniref:Uncharacterized protein n=1 Tax=Edaphochlamys debaryana TaxID=47281 RepID=A0A835YQT1_9CHLO|nr:hypothetical protein HYH03_000661 [Edaphochlamys debaryana]|eukprot:KAG2502174.1 hypothetical protein HYH03_000661 [Edaphochlamys debaryana]